MIQKKEVKKWQIDADVTQRIIAKDINMTESMVNAVFNGRRKSPKTFKKVVDAFAKRGCPREFFNAEKQEDVRAIAPYHYKPFVAQKNGV